MMVSNGLTDGKLTADTVMITIGKNNSFSVLAYDSMTGEYDSYPYDSGSWQNEDGVYTFTCEYGALTYADGKLTYSDLDFDGETVLATAVFQIVTE